jgi:hypothetical protein
MIARSRPSSNQPTLRNVETPIITRTSTINCPVNDGYPQPDGIYSGNGELDACFHGILRHIFVSSDCRYNTGEIQLSAKTQCSAKNDADVAYVLDYKTEQRYGTGPSTVDQFLGVKFHRMVVRPVAYAIRSDWCQNGTNRLRSWAFQARIASGKDIPERESWLTLDESLRSEELLKPGAHFLGFVTTENYYSEFRILQTGPSESNFLSFNLSAFEIHGCVRRL